MDHLETAFQRILCPFPPADPKQHVSGGHGRTGAPSWCTLCGPCAIIACSKSQETGGAGGERVSRYNYLGKRLAAPAKPVGTYAKAWQYYSWACTWKSGNRRLLPLEDRHQNIRDCVSGNSPDPETTPVSIGSRTRGRIVAVVPISYDRVLDSSEKELHGQGK